ncbi:MAG: KR domain-containing protein, partial [Candidatus Xenobia bacterium]
FDRVFDTKVVGLRNLLEATASDPLRAIVLFSSVTARYGRPGQLDYCMANEVLNKTAAQEARRRTGCRVVAINWGPWDGGMVNDGLRQEFSRAGIGLIPLDGGARSFLAELSHPGSDSEVLIGDGFPEAAPEPAGQRSLDAPGVPQPPAEVASEHDVLTLDVSLASYPFLDSHRLAGRPVVPVALMVEWMAHAALHGNPGMRFCGLNDLQVLKGITLEKDHVVVRLTASAARPDGEVQVSIRDDSVVYARGTVLLAETLPPTPARDRVVPVAGPRFPHALDEVYRRMLFHGPHLYAFEQIETCTDEGMTARLKPAPRPAEWVQQPLRSEWVADPLILDGCLQMGLVWSAHGLGMPALPTRAGKYRQYARFPRQGVDVVMRVQKTSSHGFTGQVDFLADGKLVASGEGLEWVASEGLRAAFDQVPVGSPGA